MGRPCTVSFPGTAHPPVVLQAGARLSERLTVQNSPVLFGCRTGICGTCRVALAGDVPPPGEYEAETLDILDDGRPGMRLLCQVELTADVEIAP